ncbi:MAG TPA: hypothetical protein VFJ15_00245 [Oleiagrimonas sp.]|nr:hypothetical protein [Oleiagrimonas sp.]
MSQRLTERIESRGKWLYLKRSLGGVVLLPLLALAIWFPGFPGGILTAPAFDYLGYACLALSFPGLALRWFIVGARRAWQWAGT